MGVLGMRSVANRAQWALAIAWPWLVDATTKGWGSVIPWLRVCVRIVHGVNKWAKVWEVAPRHEQGMSKG